MSVKTPKTTAKENPDDIILDYTLRPRTFKEYIGQEKIKTSLNIILGAAQKRNESSEHILLHGPSGLGKTTLAYLISKEMNSNLRITSGTALEKAGDVGSILSGLDPGDVLFIDEVHRLNKTIEEIIYPAMENFKLDIVIGKGTAAKTLQIDLPRFTLVAATTKISLLSSPFRSRFGASFRFDFYNESEIGKIIQRSASLLKVSINTEAIAAIAKASRYTPRVANRLLKRVRDYAQMHDVLNINDNIVHKALDMLEIDLHGLESTDRNILSVLGRDFDGGPVGLKSLAATVAEEEDTIEGVYEPYLMRIGYIARTPKGRVLTPAGYRHIGLKKKEQNLKI